MKIVRCRYLPFKGFTAINLMGVLFVKPGAYLSETLLRHERIHTAQMLEMAIIPFYLCYLIEWVVRLCRRGNAYRNISFEREAYDNEHDEHYLSNRRHYAWIKYIKQKQQNR